jgi:hypothetical protein
MNGHPFALRFSPYQMNQRTLLFVALPHHSYRGYQRVLFSFHEGITQ